MGKLSEEQAKQLADLERIRDAEDEEVVIWVRNKDGHETRLTGDRAERWCRANGYTIEEAEAESSEAEPLAPAPDAADEPEVKGATKDKPESSAAGKPGEQLEQDAPAAVKSKRAFF